MADKQNPNQGGLAVNESAIMFTLVVIVILSIVLFGDSKKEKVSATQEDEEVAKSVIEKNYTDLLYIKDSRTGLCFAYIWVGTGAGGPALAAVPCESVPFDLIKVKKFGKD